MIRDECRQFKCWRYKIEVTITYTYQSNDGAAEKLVSVRCPIRDGDIAGKSCNGTQAPGEFCRLVFVPGK